MTPEAVFDVCWETYKQCWTECYENGGLRAIDASAFEARGWKPDRKPRPEDFLADFSLAGHAVLDREGMASRRILFELYYLGLAEYGGARRWLGLSEMGWVRWTEQIRRDVGRELERRGVYPVQRYFTERAAEERR